MKTLLFAGLLGTLCGGAMLVADPGPAARAKPLTAILDTVTAAGYTSITEASYDDGQWEIEVLKGTESLELRIDPQSGKILRSFADEPHPRVASGAKSLREIASQLETGGFDSIKSVELKRGSWEVDAHNARGWRDLILDPQGKVLDDRADD